MIYLIGDMAEFAKSKNNNTRRNLMIAGGLLGAGILGTVAVKSYLRNGKLVKNYSKSTKLTSKQKLDARRKAINDYVNTNNVKEKYNLQDTKHDLFREQKYLGYDVTKDVNVDAANKTKKQLAQEIKEIADKLKQRNAYYNRQLNLTNF